MEVLESLVAGEVEDEILNAPPDDGIIQDEDAEMEVEELPVSGEGFVGEVEVEVVNVGVVDGTLVEESVMTVLWEAGVAVVVVPVMVVLGLLIGGVRGEDEKRPLKGGRKDAVFCFSGRNSPPSPTDVRVSKTPVGRWLALGRRVKREAVKRSSASSSTSSSSSLKSFRTICSIWVSAGEMVTVNGPPV